MLTLASHRVLDCFINIVLFVFPGFSDSDAAVMNVDTADLVEKLDLSISSIDMTNTALAMHEEKDGEISGVGKFIPVSWSFRAGKKNIDYIWFSCCTEELEESVLSSSSDNQTDPPELGSLAAMDLTSALTSSDTLPDPGIPPAEPSPPLTESIDIPFSLSESSDSPPLGALSLPVESPYPPAEPSAPVEDLPCDSPVDLLQSAAADEPMADNSPTQAIEDATGPAEESAEPLDVALGQHRSHESDEEEPEE